MKKNCVICSNKDKSLFNSLKPYITNIKDYEYGVNVNRSLYKCNSCELISIVPFFKSDDLIRLYPAEYSSYLNKSNPNSIFSLIKKLINFIEVKRVVKFIPPEGTIIEVGCGNGLFLEAINKLRPDIKLIGFDIVETKYIDKKLIKFHKGEFENLDHDENGCDLIYFSNLIEHVIDPKLFLDKCNFFLKPNGVFLITAPCYPHTLTKFAYKQKTLPKIAEKYIDFSTKKLEPNNIF